MNVVLDSFKMTKKSSFSSLCTFNIHVEQGTDQLARIVVASVKVGLATIIEYVVIYLTCRRKRKVLTSLLTTSCTNYTGRWKLSSRCKIMTQGLLITDKMPERRLYSN